jgi:hypothetical protein
MLDYLPKDCLQWLSRFLFSCAKHTGDIPNSKQWATLAILSHGFHSIIKELNVPFRFRIFSAVHSLPTTLQHIVWDEKIQTLPPPLKTYSFQYVKFDSLKNVHGNLLNCNVKKLSIIELTDELRLPLNLEKLSFKFCRDNLNLLQYSKLTHLSMQVHFGHIWFPNYLQR